MSNSSLKVKYEGNNLLLFLKRQIISPFDACIKCQTWKINNLATRSKIHVKSVKNRKKKTKSFSLIFLCFQILPGLESFCAYCAIGIGAIYLFQCSWFVAWLSLDQRRIEARRDGLIPCCLVHKDWNPSTHKNQDNWTRNAFTYFANLVRNKIFKVSKPLTFLWYLDFFGICKNEKTFDKDEKLFSFNLQ